MKKREKEKKRGSVVSAVGVLFLVVFGCKEN